MFLPPTVFCRHERVVAGETGKLGVFGPDIFFVEALAFRAPREAVHFRAQLHGLAGAPIAHAAHAASSTGLPGADSRGDFQWRGITAEKESSSKKRSGWPAAIIS